MTLPDNLAVPEDVPNSVVDAVVDAWTDVVQEQMGRDTGDLVDCHPWMFTESMEYLVDSILTVLGVSHPAAVSFSFMDSLTVGGTCEVLIVWKPGQASRYIDPFNLEDNCSVMRMVDMPWPSMIEFLSDADERKHSIKRLIWMMSASLEVMPKESE